MPVTRGPERRRPGEAGHWAGDSEDEDIPGRQRADVGHPGRDGEPGDDDGELTAGDQRRPRTQAAGDSDPVATRGVPAGRPLVVAVTSASSSTAGSTGRAPVGSVEAEGDEERGGEQVAQRAENGTRPVGERRGQGQPDEKRPHRGGGAQRLGQPGDEQGEADQPEQDLLVVGWAISRPSR
jgi:hypothetical protein